MEGDDEDFIFFGTPIEREEEMMSRKRKAVAESAGNLRTLPSWKQEVRDEEGRRRFHGAFTGGFSAGYYNTVGSKEGWTPQSFTSSRKNRAEVKAQSIYNFLDEDEKAEMENHLGTSQQFDTFGFTAAELARKQVEKEQSRRPSAIPGPVPDELVLPVANSIGVKLLLKMGWRHGHSIKEAHSNSSYKARREARKAFLAFSQGEERSQRTKCEPNESDSNIVEGSNDGDDDDVFVSRSTPVYVLNPKQDLHGLGFDPFKHAPEFRERKRLQTSANKEPGSRLAVSKLFASKSGRAAPGFSIGALEEYDVEDEDIYTSGFEFEETYVEEDEEPSGAGKENKLLLGKKANGVLPGFKIASCSEYQLERFYPPVIPPDFDPHHKFPALVQTDSEFVMLPPMDVSPPEDDSLRLLIEGFANLVARCGKVFEDISKARHKSNPLFSFLFGGNGHDFYARKLWEEQQKRVDQQKLGLSIASSPSVQKMTAEKRGRILGEKPLERSSKDSSASVPSTQVQLQYNLFDTFTQPTSLVESLVAAKPFKHDPAKQERFEHFLKDKYQGGLRSTSSAGNSFMSEADRARERLDFEAAAEAIEKGIQGSTSAATSERLLEFLETGKGHFTSDGIQQQKLSSNEETNMKKYPQREEYQWRPALILCKRFEIIDPFMGKPPPAPRRVSKMDSLIFMPDFVKTESTEKTSAVENSSSASHPEMQEADEESSRKEADDISNSTHVERPVDLYKAIFSDDSDDEEKHDSNLQDNDEKKNEAANTTLNRLIAGDFLESLGKELGLEVPRDTLYPINQTLTSSSQKNPTIVDDAKVLWGNNRSVTSIKTSNESSDIKDANAGKYIHPQTTTGLSSLDANRVEEQNKVAASTDSKQHLDDNIANSNTNVTDVGHLGHRSDDVRKEKLSREERRHKKCSRRHQSTGSLETESSASDDYGSRERSSRQKKRHSKHHSHKRRESSPKSSRHKSNKDYEEDRRDKRKLKEREKHSSSKSSSNRRHH